MLRWRGFLEIGRELSDRALLWVRVRVPRVLGAATNTQEVAENYTTTWRKLPLSSLKLSLVWLLGYLKAEHGCHLKAVAMLWTRSPAQDQ